MNSPEISSTAEITNQSSPYNSSGTDPVLDSAVVETEAPQYMRTDPGIVGYENVDIQYDTYRFAITGVIPLSGKTSILDIGAGRGDLYHYVKKLLPSLQLAYTGYEINSILSDIGNKSFETHESFIVNKNFIDVEFLDNEKYDHVFAIGTLNIDYGWNTDDWTHIELLITKALELSNYSVTLILLHDNGGFDMYKSFPIPNIADMILQFNCSFTIDYDNETGIYKLTLKKL